LRYYHRKKNNCKKLKDTLKSQVVVDKKSKKIICVAQSEGRKHDYPKKKRLGTDKFRPAEGSYRKRNKKFKNILNISRKIQK
jgi:hypothetical protein